MQAIYFQGNLSAFARGDTIVFSPTIAALERDHPNRRWVAAVAVFGTRAERNELAYEPERAERFSRELLMPQREFLNLADEPDHRLAQHFAVPLDRVSQRRADLAAVAR